MKVGFEQVLVVGFVLGLGAQAAHAIYLDDDRNISFRMRMYSQASIRIPDQVFVGDGSEYQTTPETEEGQLIQHRNFYNPELDAILTSYMSWMDRVGLGVIKPDDFSFRVAGRGFYDGIYDYGTSQFNDTAVKINRNWPYPDLDTAFQIVGKSFSCPTRVGVFNECAALNDQGQAVSQTDIKRVYPGADAPRPRDVYASQERLNELYLSYTKGPFFLRVGRQAISWGEADTIALLDQNNPFDITAGPPGAFLDIDEARIPLWTIRSSLNLFENLGPFSSGFLEGYWVPGTIENNVGMLPILTASPYSPARQDPQETVRSLPISLRAQFVLLDHIPNNSMRNSRYGARFQTVIAREHTFSVWYYTAFPSQPVPRGLGLTRFVPQDGEFAGQQTRLYTVETVHRLTQVFGIADSFFLEPLDGIVRLEAEYFKDEPGFIPEISLGASNPINRAVPEDPNSAQDPLKFLSYKGAVPTADILRWETGFDRFFFFRALNPTNSFTWASAIVGQWNITETQGDKISVLIRENPDGTKVKAKVKPDFGFAGQTKPNHLGFDSDDFVQLKEVEAFAQTHLETSYMHGRLVPAITVIANVRGTHAVLPEINYRWNDSLLFGVKLVYIGGEYQQLGFFRDRDQISLRVTYQIN
jgi:hypothetical protein